MRATKYKEEGHIEASTRITERVDLFMKRYLDIVAKLRAVLIPSDFEEKLTSIEASLSVVQMTRKELALTSHEPEFIEKQLQRCVELYGVLSTMKPEMECLIKNGRKYSIYHSEPEMLNRRLDSIKETYNSLGDNVPQLKVILEEGLTYAREVEALYNGLAPWLEQVRMECIEPDYIQVRRIVSKTD